jgi:hypothetical protein
MNLLFNAKAAEAAYAEWGANCGPMSLAAALALDLPTVRTMIDGFEGKGYTNPTMMLRALDRAGIKYQRSSKLKTQDLCEGINRLQWEGPWLRPGVPPAAAYGYTHWVAAAEGRVFCTATAVIGWMPRKEWERRIATVCQEIKRCTGWHVTDHYAFEVLAKGARQ